MPGTSTGSPVSLQKITAPAGSDLRMLEIQHNNAVADLQAAAFAGSVDAVWAWQTAAANSGQALGRGSTDTNIASGAFKFSINGIPEAKAAVAAGTAIGAQTVPANTWAVYALDIATGGTITVTAGAANATTGYATEALAKAAVPLPVTAKARMGYITVKTAVGQPFVAATDALAGGSSGNPASETNYYPFDGIFAPTGIALNGNGVVSAAGQGVYGGASAVGSGAAWTGGRNGILIHGLLSRGSTDTRVATPAITFNANGICNIAKAAVAAGTAFGSLGTIPANKWGIIVIYVNSLGTVSYMSGPANYTSGYNGERDAINDLANVFPSAGLCQMGYVTIKTEVGSPFIVGTDALAGGASGNPASATNYYPTQGVISSVGFLQAGFGSAKIATTAGVALTTAQY